MHFKALPRAQRRNLEACAEFEALQPAGPLYNEDTVTFETDSSWKVSNAHIPPRPETQWDSVLLARMCFKSSKLERPTTAL